MGECHGERGGDAWVWSGEHNSASREGGSPMSAAIVGVGLVVVWLVAGVLVESRRRLQAELAAVRGELAAARTARLELEERVDALEGRREVRQRLGVVAEPEPRRRRHLRAVPPLVAAVLMAPAEELADRFGGTSRQWAAGAAVSALALFGLGLLPADTDQANGGGEVAEPPAATRPERPTTTPVPEDDDGRNGGLAGDGQDEADDGPTTTLPGLNGPPALVQTDEPATTTTDTTMTTMPAETTTIVPPPTTTTTTQPPGTTSTTTTTTTTTVPSEPPPDDEYLLCIGLDLLGLLYLEMCLG